MKRKRNRGAVLPIVLVALVITQLTFYSVMEIYENQIETYILLSQHYQSQTLLSITESKLNENVVSRSITFNIGRVQIEKISEKSYKLTCQLSSGYTELKTITVK